MPGDLWGSIQQPDEGCWIWPGERDHGGYGRCSIGRSRKQAHRIAYERAYGPIPEGMFVLHSCDVRACVRPDHLRLGTAKDNSDDMATRGRRRYGARYGADHPTAKLSRIQAWQVRRIYESSRVSRTSLARIFGVSVVTIARVTRGQSYVEAR